jgi:hypothetical protein
VGPAATQSPPRPTSPFTPAGSTRRYGLRWPSGAPWPGRGRGCGRPRRSGRWRSRPPRAGRRKPPIPQRVGPVVEQPPCRGRGAAVATHAPGIDRAADLIDQGVPPAREVRLIEVELRLLAASLPRRWDRLDVGRHAATVEDGPVTLPLVIARWRVGLRNGELRMGFSTTTGGVVSPLVVGAGPAVVSQLSLETCLSAVRAGRICSRGRPRRAGRSVVAYPGAGFTRPGGAKPAVRAAGNHAVRGSVGRFTEHPGPRIGSVGYWARVRDHRVAILFSGHIGALLGMFIVFGTCLALIREQERSVSLAPKRCALRSDRPRHRSARKL